MKISYNWLKEYIDTDLNPDEIADLLTNIGLEVEGVETFESVKGGLKGCFIGEVKTCKQHPNADKLSITTVDIGEDELLPIVCGAPNVQEGQKVVVATVGTTLYKGEESLTLKKVKIRGEVSEGMICAEDELGLGDSHEGILVLDPKAKPGIPARDYFDVQTDTVFEIGLTPNRIDGASHYGVARDLAAVINLESKSKARKPEVKDLPQDNKDLTIEVVIEDNEGCKRYSGVTITGVQVQESPAWLQSRLKSIGQNPINNIVDITNFVLNELGQPLHAFDADKIKGNKVVVRTMKQDTPFITLDGEERKLSSEDLMICDIDTGMCIAGILGGVESGVTEKTQNIFLESACFSPTYIRKTAKRHGISTDASFHFERGSDPEMTVFALKRAAHLIRDIAHGKISSPIVDIYPEPVAPFKVQVLFNHITRLVGKEIDLNTVRLILESLDIKIIKEDGSSITVLVPPYRVDVQREADVIEEILRIYGYNNIEINEQLTSVLTYLDRPDKEKLTHVVSDYLSHNGFNEIISNSLTKESYYTHDPNAVSIFNPLSSDLNRMRTNLFYSGMEALSYNVNRQQHNLRFYEFGNCYFYQADAKGNEILRHYHEEEHLAIFLTGNRSDGNWIQKDVPASFYQLKSIVENLLGRIGLSMDEMKLLPSRLDFLKEGLYAQLEDLAIGNLGIVHENYIEQFDLKSEVFFAELIWTNIIKKLTGIPISFKELPRFPEVRRDLSMVLEKKIKFEYIRSLAFKTEKQLLNKVILFDVYEGKNIGQGKKSYAVSFYLQNTKETLTDKQIDEIMNKLEKKFKAQLGAIIRR